MTTTPVALAGLGTTVVLCDADGNLFPSEEPAFDASVEVTNAFLASLGVAARYTAEQLRLTTTGKNFRTTAVDLAGAGGVRLDGPALSRATLEEWVREERARVSEHLGRVLRPDPAVRAPLEALAARFRLAVVSSSALGRLDACFTATGLADLLPPAVRYSAEDSLAVPTGKPDPAVYAHACRALGVEPAHALAVEDSLPGVQSAVAAGIPTVGNLQFVPPAEREEREELLRAAGALTVVRSWGELAGLL